MCFAAAAWDHSKLCVYTVYRVHIYIYSSFTNQYNPTYIFPKNTLLSGFPPHIIYLAFLIYFHFQWNYRKLFGQVSLVGRVSAAAVAAVSLTASHIPVGPYIFFFFIFFFFFPFPVPLSSSFWTPEQQQQQQQQQLNLTSSIFFSSFSSTLSLLLSHTLSWTSKNVVHTRSWSVGWYQFQKPPPPPQINGWHVAYSDVLIYPITL